MADQNEMEKIVTPMMEHVCDNLCIYPVKCNECGGLEYICNGCQMDKYANDILNTYNAACQLQVAAGIVRSELLKKDDWYYALVESIYRYLRKAVYITSWDQLARELADRIVGSEPEQEVE